MGNRIVAHTIANIGKHPGTKVTNCVLAAPDIDRDVFLQLAASLSKGAENVTLYALSRDKALRASMRVNGYPRAGYCGKNGKNIIVVNGVCTIDVSAVDSDFLGHGYVGDNNSIISDLYYLIKGKLPPRDRLRKKEAPSGTYWRFVP